MEGSERPQTVGDVVHFVDPTGGIHTALVTAWWSKTCCNVVITSGDAAKRDEYGRQIERYTSLMHKSSIGTAYGQYWKWPDEEPNPYRSPMAV